MHILLATLFSLGLTISVQADTGRPSNRIVCEAPELTALSGKLGRNLCVQKSIVANLSVTGPALHTAARALLEHPIGYNPSRDPDAITCRQDSTQTGTRLPPVMTCGYNRDWKALWGPGPQFHDVVPIPSQTGVTMPNGHT